MEKVDEIRYILFGKRGIKMDETTDKRKLKRWLKDGARVINSKVVKYPSLEDSRTFVVIELENRRLGI